MKHDVEPYPLNLRYCLVWGGYLLGYFSLLTYGLLN
tara:strand:+ start:21249 stop:21356 length:108 start_codon:yes stop_codon:yes gene_type:complete